MVDLISPSSWNGVWQLSDESSLEAGVLSVDGVAGAQLRIHRPGQFMESLRLITTGTQPSKIVGALMDGRRCVLDGCLIVETKSSLVGSIITIRPQTIRIGVEKDQVDAPDVCAVRFHIPNVQIVLSIPDLTEQINNSDFTNSRSYNLYNRKETLYKADDMSIMLSVFLSAEYSDSLVLSPNTMIEIHFSDMRDLNYCLQTIGYFSDLLSLLSGNWVAQSSMQTREGDKWVDIWFQHVFSDHTHPKKVSLDRSIKVNIEEFQEIYSNWVLLREKFARALSLMRGAGSNNISMIDSKFLLSIQAIESLHSNLHNGQYLEKKKFGQLLTSLKEKISSIVDDVNNNRLKERLESTFDFDNHYSLRDRIDELVDESSVLKMLCSDQISRELNNARNGLSHGRGPSISGEKYFQLYMTASAILQTTMLERILPNSEDINTAITMRFQCIK